MNLIRLFRWARVPHRIRRRARYVVEFAKGQALAKELLKDVTDPDDPQLDLVESYGCETYRPGSGFYEGYNSHVDLVHRIFNLSRSTQNKRRSKLKTLKLRLKQHLVYRQRAVPHHSHKQRMAENIRLHKKRHEQRDRTVDSLLEGRQG
jgi:hypothetical protein